MPTHTRLKGVSHVADALVSDQLETNLINFFQWGFLGVGGFFNVRRPVVNNYLDDMEGYYRFEGNLNDSSGHGRTLANVSSAVVGSGTGAVGTGFFDSGTATASGLSVPYSDLTLSAWIRPSLTTGGTSVQLQTGGINKLSFSRANGTLRCAVNGSTVVSGGLGSLNVWHHALATCSGGTLRLYKDGVFIGSGVAPAATTIDTFNFAPGTNTRLDEIGVWTRAFSAAEVTALYNSGSGFNPLSIVEDDGTLGAYGGQQFRLRPVTDPSYDDGAVWEAHRKDWVWESGVEYSVQPIRVSGVYVDDIFVPVGTGLSVDYPNGRVTFTEAVSQSSTVECEFSYRHFQVYTADHPVWKQVQTESYRLDDTQFLQVGSGAWDVLAQNRVQLPAVFVEAVPNATLDGLQLGGGVKVRQDVLFHILAEERFHYKWLHDALILQKDKRLQGFDKNLLLSQDAFPLDEYGSPRGSGLMYPDLVKATGDGGYFWEQIRISDMRGVEQPRLGHLWYSTVRGQFEMDRYE